VGDERIQCLLYADDLVLMSNTNGGLQRLLYQTNKWAAEYQLEINTEKTEYIIFGPERPNNVRVGSERIQSRQVTTYLGFSRSTKSV
jgi:hypothetical protein